MTDRFRVGANLATLGNALLGVGAIAYTLAGNKLWAMLLVAIAIGFDGLDGLLSRRSRLPPSTFGRVADSLADATTFGLAPAVMLAVHTSDPAAWAPYAVPLTVAAGAYLAAAVARLAYFTLRAYELPHFLGVPTPQSALAVIVLLLFHDTPGYASVEPLGALVGIAVLATMMVVPIPYPKIRRRAALRPVATLTAVAAAVSLVILQFRPMDGSALAVTAEASAFAMLLGVAVYYLAGPWSARRDGRFANPG